MPTYEAQVSNSLSIVVIDVCTVRVHIRTTDMSFSDVQNQSKFVVQQVYGNYTREFGDYIWFCSSIHSIIRMRTSQTTSRFGVYGRDETKNCGMTSKHSHTSQCLWHTMSYFNGSKSAKDKEEQNKENTVTMRRQINGGKDGLDRQWEQ